MKKKIPLSWFRFALIIVVSVGFDQALKRAAYGSLKLFQLEPILPGLLSGTRINNYGGIFGYFPKNQEGWQIWLTAYLPLFLLSVAWVFLLRNRSRMNAGAALCLALLLSGATSNLHDSIAFGRVVDCLALHWGKRIYPFNPADLLIWCGWFGFVAIHAREAFGAVSESIRGSFHAKSGARA